MVVTAPGRSAFAGATLIDGTGAAPLEDAAVVVEDGRIAWVGRRADLGGDVGVVDVGGRYVVPGLMDANVHLVLDYEPEVLLRYEPGCWDELVVEAAQVALRAGVTTVFDTWGPLEALRRVRDRIAAGDVAGSRIFCAGNIIGNAGPWSTEFTIPYGQQLNEVLNPDVIAAINRHWEQGVGGDLPWMPASEVRAAVREYIASSGIDFVKYASSVHGTAKFLTFSPDAQRAIVDEAHAAGLTAQACAMTPEALKLAIEAGVDLLQHGNSTGRHPMPAETVALIAERQLPCVALLYTRRYIESFLTAGEADDLNFQGARLLVRDGNARELICAGAKLLLAIDGGVYREGAATSTVWGPYVVGPDVPYHLGRSHFLWLQGAIECGMTPMAALQAATRNIAEAYGKGDELGTLEPGKRADLLVLEADPLADVRNVERIVHVVKDGRAVDRDALPEHPVLTGTDRLFPAWPAAHG